MHVFDNFDDISIWQKLCPHLTITNNPFAASVDQAFELNLEDSAICEARIRDEGYFITRALFDSDKMNRLAGAINLLAAQGLPPAFVYIYDEAWQAFGRLSRIYEGVLGHDYRLKLGGIWAWYIEAGSSGFPPHRDITTLETMHDGKPANLTVWIAVSDALPDNGCIYLLPKNRDPNHPHNLEKQVVPNPQFVRALPAPAGAVLAWTQSVIHWGASSSHWAKGPRISMAASFSRVGSDTETENYGLEYTNSPAMAMAPSTLVPLERRLEIISEAIWFFAKRVLENHPETSERLFRNARQHVGELTRSRMDENFEQLMLSSQRHAAQSLFEKKRYDEALPLLRKLCSAIPYNASLRQGLGLTLHYLNRNEDAVKELRKATELAPDDNTMRQMLARIETLAGK